MARMMSRNRETGPGHNTLAGMMEQTERKLIERSLGEIAYSLQSVCTSVLLHPDPHIQSFLETPFPPFTDQTVGSLATRALLDLQAKNSEGFIGFDCIFYPDRPPMTTDFYTDESNGQSILVKIFLNLSSPDVYLWNHTNPPEHIIRSGLTTLAEAEAILIHTLQGHP